MPACAPLRLTDTSLPAQSLRLLRRPGSSLLQWGAGLLACAQSMAGLQLSCCAPAGSSPAQLTAVQVGRAYARPTQPKVRPRRTPAGPPRMRRGAHAHIHPARPTAPSADLPPCLTTHTPVCPHSCRARRGLSNEVLYVFWVCVFCLKMRCIGQKILPGLRPGPRGRTGPLAGYGVCWGVPQCTSMAGPDLLARRHPEPTGTEVRGS